MTVNKCALIQRAIDDILNNYQATITISIEDDGRYVVVITQTDGNLSVMSRPSSNLHLALVYAKSRIDDIVDEEYHNYMEDYNVSG